MTTIVLNPLLVVKRVCGMCSAQAGRMNVPWESQVVIASGSEQWCLLMGGLTESCY